MKYRLDAQGIARATFNANSPVERRKYLSALQTRVVELERKVRERGDIAGETLDRVKLIFARDQLRHLGLLKDEP